MTSRAGATSAGGRGTRCEDEYRRLLYVAMTRAADRLVITGSPRRERIPDGSGISLVDKALKPDAVEEPATMRRHGVALAPAGAARCARRPHRRRSDASRCAGLVAAEAPAGKQPRRARLRIGALAASCRRQTADAGSVVHRLCRRSALSLERRAGRRGGTSRREEIARRANAKRSS